jgi:serine/threonine protein phosphatase PrpC
MRWARLIGRDHTILRELAAVAEGEAALAISRGGARKTYDYVEPNEDAALFALGDAGMFVALADGHNGAGGSQAVLHLLRETFAPAWTAAGEGVGGEAGWRRSALDALLACNHAVLAEGAASQRPPAPTTLSFVLVRPCEGLLAHAAMGDSHIFRVSQESGEELGWAAGERERTYFLGYAAETADGMADKCIIDTSPLEGARAIVLATDGLSERGIGVADPGAVALQAVDQAENARTVQRPLSAAKTVAHIAMRAHREQRAGDNIATAVLWLQD